MLLKTFCVANLHFKEKLPFSCHNSPQNIKYGQIEQGLYVYRFLLLLHKEVYHTISLLKQHTLQRLLSESEILQRLERKSSMRFPGVAIVKKQTYNNSMDRFAIDNIFFVLCKQNLLKLIQRNKTIHRDQIFEAETDNMESVSYNYGAK